MFSGDYIATLVSRFFVLLIAMSVHEFAHAYVAHLMGDDTAKSQGRMTLDPRANIYWPGFIVGVLIGFAVLGSAPVNPYRMRKRRLGMFLAVLAGPFSNLIVAALFALPFRLGLVNPVSYGTVGGILPTLPRFLFDMIYLNIVLFLFNILPLFPLDGWTVTLSALPTGPAIWWERQKMNSQYVLIALIVLSFLAPSLADIYPPLGYADVLSLILGGPSIRILYFLVGI
ncbi:MAG: site-2 protease family protein [Anaerolineae bacterium]|nr:site-2 protease family protein [Anaerolineae bacterium]